MNEPAVGAKPRTCRSQSFRVAPEAVGSAYNRVAPEWLRTHGLVAIAGFGLVMTLALSRGGYYPTAWGWYAFAAIGLVVLRLVRGPPVLLGKLEVAALVAFAVFVLWVGLSGAWGAPGRAVLEAERAVVYLATLTAVLVWLRRESIEALAFGVCTAISIACAYGLLTRLSPERFGVVDLLAQARLAEPLGYWNALGLFAVLGLLLALGLAAHSGWPAVRALAAASAPVFLLALYFTYGRGAWIALAVGLAATFAVDPRRLRALLTGLALAPATAAALVVAYDSDALNRSGAQLADASREGHRVAAVLVAAAVVNALVALSLRRLERRLVVSRPIRRVLLVAMAVLTVALVLGALVRAGGPVTFVSRVWEGFAEPAPEVGDRASERLFSVSGSNRLAQWRVAWRVFEREPVVGLGAGTYEESWYELRSDAYKVRDAHSLYLESLAELGVVGTALLLTALGMPLLTVRRLGRVPVAPAAFGAYAAFLVRAGTDWDWEMPAVTVVAVVCAGVVLVAARAGSTLSVPRPAVAVALVACLGVAAFSTVGLVGNRALADADSALRAGDVERAAERARSGLRWAPWSAQGHRVLAESHLLEGDLAGAHVSIRQAVEADPRNWELWFALAQIASGVESTQALAEARRLNPLSPEIRAYVRSLEQSP